MDSEAQLAMNLGETYLVTETGNERLRETEVRFSGFVALSVKFVTKSSYKVL